MGKKKLEAVRPTRSFDEMVGDATIAKLKPWVQELVIEASRITMQSVFQTVMQERSAMQVRQLALESLIRKYMPEFTTEAMADEIANVEDEADGRSTVVGPIETGDTVRLKFAMKSPLSETWSESSLLAIKSVGLKGSNGYCQVSEAFETALTGRMTNSIPEIFQISEVLDEGALPTITDVKVEIHRISRKKGPENV